MGDERTEASGSEGGPRTWARALLTHKQAADFVLGGLATVTAVLFTNPIEVNSSLIQSLTSLNRAPDEAAWPPGGVLETKSSAISKVHSEMD